MASEIPAHAERDVFPGQRGVEAVTDLHDRAAGPKVNVRIISKHGDRSSSRFLEDCFHGPRCAEAGVNPAGQHHDQRGSM
jgi:hypothetical protein